MYQKLFAELKGARILGLTATPYRLVTDGWGGSILKFLTRTRPRIFKDLIYYVQNRELFEQGYLTKLEYRRVDGFDTGKLKINSTGADYTDKSVQQYYEKSNFKERLVETVRKAIRVKKNCLAFTRFIKEAEYVADRVNGCVLVTGKTPKKEREEIIGGFKSGRIKAICNVGILSAGFDFPELECIIMARPTMSLALYYQIIGRGIRPHPGKENTFVIDMCNNFRLFGKVENLEIVDGGNGKWFISDGRRRLTNIYYGDRRPRR